jgi:hypothetical protein
MLAQIKKKATEYFAKSLPKFWNWLAWEVLFNKKSEKENILQWFVRQFFAVDSSGKPSVTITILFFVMTLIAIVTAIELKVAFSTIVTINSDGGREIQLKGISDNFYYLLGGLSMVVTYFFNDREKRVHGAAKSEETPTNLLEAQNPLENFKDKAVETINIIKKVKTKTK